MKTTFCYPWHLQSLVPFDLHERFTLGNEPKGRISKAWENVHMALCSKFVSAIALAFMLAFCTSDLAADEFYVDIQSQSSDQTGSFEFPFHSIAGAVDYIRTSDPLQDDFADIIIKPGAYNENIIIRNPSFYNPISWRFRAYEDNVTVTGNLIEGPIFISQAMSGTSLFFENLDFTTNEQHSAEAFCASSPNEIDSLKFSNCTFSGFSSGILITEAPHSVITTHINNFEVEECYFEGMPHGGQGICAIARSDEICGDQYNFVENISIHNNTFRDDNIACISLPEHVYICVSITNWRKNASAYDKVYIYENSFESNTAHVYPYGVTLDRLNRLYYLLSQRDYKVFIFENKFLNNRINSRFTKVKFIENRAQIYDMISCPFFKFEYCDINVELSPDTLWVERNIVHAPYVYGLGTAKLHDKQNSYFGSEKFIHAEHAGAHIVNSIAIGYNEYFHITGIEPGTVHSKHCYYDTQETNNLVSYENCIFDIDPLISHHSASLGYDLNWDYDQRSPLINAGCPEIDGEPQYDPDGTPPDIGAVYYPHHHQEYFQIGSASNIYWLSFPVVDDRTNTNGGLYWNELGYMFGEQMLNAPNSNLNNIGWSYDGQRALLSYVDNEWENSHHPVTQPKGYKVQFNSGVSNCAVVVDGFKADPNTTPVSWVVVNNQNQPFENWIGYFVTKTNRAGDALSRFIPGSTSYTYLDYVHTIKTQTWVTSRISEEIGSRWIVNPNSYTLSEGQMVALLLLPNAPREMYWNTEYPPVAPIVRPRAAAFDYEEKLDYTPVFLEFDPEDMPAEVGLYVNGVCKGAAVVDTTTVDVALYLDDAKDGGELQIMFYYEGKGKKAAKGWKVYNPESLVFEDTGLRAEQIGKYAYLSFTSKEGDSPVPLITQLDQNYPNPFNPSTSISFVLAKDMSARLDIYNVRGQKVSTLCNSELTKGKHTLQWNGVDAQGRKVASGIYFSRLATPEGSFSQKMMLMK